MFGSITITVGSVPFRESNDYFIQKGFSWWELHITFFPHLKWNSELPNPKTKQTPTSNLHLRVFE